VARGVFKESVRDRIGYNLVFFAVLLMAASILLAQVTAGQDVKIIKALGLAAASAIGMLLAVFVGISLVSKEVERRSIYSLLSKPITRQQFILGKYLGLTFTLVVNLAIMAVAYYAVLVYIDWQTPALTSQGWEAPAADPRLLKAFALIGVELMLVTALALFFSTFSSAFLAAGLTIAVYVIGHFNTDLKNLSSLGNSPVLIAIGKGLYYTLPNLTLLDVKADVVHAHTVSGQQMLAGILSAGLYIGLLLTASIIVFSRRDFK